MAHVRGDVPTGGPSFYERLREANQRELSQEDRDRIVAEESLAWQLGREA